MTLLAIVMTMTPVEYGVMVRVLGRACNYAPAAVVTAYWLGVFPLEGFMPAVQLVD